MNRFIFVLIIIVEVFFITACDDSIEPPNDDYPDELTYLRLETKSSVAKDSSKIGSMVSMNNGDLYMFNTNDSFELSLNIAYSQVHNSFFNTLNYKIELIETDQYEVIGENVIESTYDYINVRPPKFKNNDFTIKFKKIDGLTNGHFVFKITYDLSEYGEKQINFCKIKCDDKKYKEYETICRYGYDNLSLSFEGLFDEELNQYLFYSYTTNSSYGFVKTGYEESVSELEFYKYSYYGVNKISLDDYYSKLILLKYNSYVNLGISNRRVIYVSPTLRFECNLDETIAPIFCHVFNGVPFIPYINPTNEELGNGTKFLLNYLLEKEYLTKEEYDVELSNLILENGNYSVKNVEYFNEEWRKKDEYGFDDLNIFTEIEHRRIILETNIDSNIPEDFLLGEE